MFYKYEIQRSMEGDILYLYLSMKYEFANEFSLEDEKDLERRTKNFIASNHIPFHGHKIYLVIDGKIVKTLNIKDMDTISSPSEEYSLDSYMVHVQLEDFSLCEISLREYLLGFKYIFLNSSYISSGIVLFIPSEYRGINACNPPNK